MWRKTWTCEVSIAKRESWAQCKTKFYFTACLQCQWVLSDSWVSNQLNYSLIASSLCIDASLISDAREVKNCNCNQIILEVRLDDTFSLNCSCAISNCNFLLIFGQDFYDRKPPSVNLTAAIKKLLWAGQRWERWLQILFLSKRVFCWNWLI